MKKWTIGLLMMALVIALGATSAFAAGWGGRYADADGDGICDNAGANCQYADADGDGICDNAGANCRYADANSDGICDNAGARTGGRRGFCGGRGK